MIEAFKLSAIVLVLDGIFLFFKKRFFSEQISAVQKSEMKVNAFGAMLSYFFIILSLYWFVIQQGKSVVDAFVLGVCVYGVYEYTNYALFTNWRLKTTLVDTLWGGVLFALTTFVYNKLK